MPYFWFQRKNVKLFTVEYDVTCDFVINSHYHVEICLCYTNFDESFYYEWILNFAKCFFYVYWDYYVIFTLPFVNVLYDRVWWMDIKLFLHPREKPLDHGVWCFLYIFELGMLMFCWGFLHVYSLDILAYNFLFFFFLRFFIWFCRQGNCGLVVWECSHLFGFLK